MTPAWEDVLAAWVHQLKGPAQLVVGNLMKIISCKLLTNKETTIQGFEPQPPQPDGHRSLARPNK